MNHGLADRLRANGALKRAAFAEALLPVLCGPTGKTPAGYPYLHRYAYEHLRDRVPHLLCAGQQVLDALSLVSERSKQIELNRKEARNLTRSARVIRQVVRTAAVTAPSDLWLLRHVLGLLAEVGLIERLLHGEVLDPRELNVRWRDRETLAVPREADADLSFLLSRGYLEQTGEGRYFAAAHPRARAVLEAAAPIASEPEGGVASLWTNLFLGEPLGDIERSCLESLSASLVTRTDWTQDTWIATWEEVDLGWRLLPVVLGLRAAELSKPLSTGPVSTRRLGASHADLAAGALSILEAAGVIARAGDEGVATAVGKRVLSRGAGPMGIIEAYHPYMRHLGEILTGDAAGVWVTRGTNLAASQDANRATFEKANDALDAFCAATGFAWTVFVEHAIGRGEATRQRFERNGEAGLHYVGADLEDAAIDAALSEQKAGRLPKDMVFVRQADIGRPDILVAALEARGIPTEGAVMVVGNGFHEVRGADDERMVEVFRGYHEAGFVLLFTEENALSVDDLRATAWNTYHAGFKYVHEKSGQGLRPATEGDRSTLGQPLRASWTACATRAGYIEARDFESRSRTIYPLRRQGQPNPSISENHFFVPGPIAARLGLAKAPA
ncbi:MAG: hypothetical protein ACYS22_03200 [Planctomycetota bacterium]